VTIVEAVAVLVWMLLIAILIRITFSWPPLNFTRLRAWLTNAAKPLIIMERCEMGRFLFAGRYTPGIMMEVRQKHAANSILACPVNQVVVTVSTGMTVTSDENMTLIWSDNDDRMFRFYIPFGPEWPAEFPVVLPRADITLSADIIRSNPRDTLVLRDVVCPRRDPMAHTHAADSVPPPPYGEE
jgi:hypothetical protein